MDCQIISYNLFYIVNYIFIDLINLLNIITIMKLEETGFYTLSDMRCRNVSSTSPIWRSEILLTDKCNFRCPYCRGMVNKGDVEKDKLFTILDYLFSERVKNIRFSGGEPTLYPYLGEAVNCCDKNIDVERIALSTNGSADLDYYKELIDLGINDFSISLDACCANTANIMAGKQVYYNTIIDNIRELSKLTYVTVGIVFDEKNVSQLKGIISVSMELGVDDIRIIPSAQYKNEEGIPWLPEMKNYPILKYRVKNLTVEEISIRGLRVTDNHRCPLVLDDIAISGNYHFPCIIYLREKGEPIGNLFDLKQIRKQREKWYLKHNCFEDNICKNNCLDVCREYNNKYAEFRKE